MTTVVTTKYKLDMHNIAMTAEQPNTTQFVHIGDECEITSNEDCVIVMGDPLLFGIWKAKLKKNVPKTFTVKEVRPKTNWFAMDPATYRQQEPSDESGIIKTSRMVQNPPVLP